NNNNNNNNSHSMNWYFVLSAATICYIVLPYIGNIVYFLKLQKKWGNDIRIHTHVRGWLAQWGVHLLLMNLLSGGMTVGVELCNSNCFGWDLFAMGLTERYLKKLSIFRVCINVVFENIPSLACQLLFTYVWNDSKWEVITTWAAVITCTSVAWDLFHFYRSSTVFCRHTTYFGEEHTTFDMQLHGSHSPIANQNAADWNWDWDDFEFNRKYLVLRPLALKRAIAKCLQLHASHVEINHSILVNNGGIQIGFTIFNFQKNLVQLTDAIVSCCDQQSLQQAIGEHWELHTKMVHIAAVHVMDETGHFQSVWPSSNRKIGRFSHFQSFMLLSPRCDNDSAVVTIPHTELLRTGRDVASIEMVDNLSMVATVKNNVADMIELRSKDRSDVAVNNTLVESSKSVQISSDDKYHNVNLWNCESCTFSNNPNADTCTRCGDPRQPQPDHIIADSNLIPTIGSEFEHVVQPDELTV
ncbi:hypothetical protein RFI_15677, partial [Reticulomyxa filosa]